MGTVGSWNWGAGFARQVSSSEAKTNLRAWGEAPSSTASPDLTYELLAMFVRNEAVAALTVPILAVVIAVTMLSWADPRQLLLWVATIFIAEGILLALCREFKKQPREQLDLDQWRRKLASAEFFYAVCWAVVAFTSFTHGEQAAAYFFLFAALTVVTAIRMLFAASVTTILHAGTIPVTAALCLRFLMTGEVFYWLMAVVAAGIHFYFVFLVKNLQRTAFSMLDYRAKKDRLIEELKKEKASADEARSRAEAANLAKSKFLANMSHELRTPLNAIMGFAEMIKDEYLGPAGHPNYKSYAADIHASGEHLLKLINGILDLSRIEAGKYELSEKPVDLGVIARECVHLLRLDAQSKNLRLGASYAPAMPCVMADEKALRQICLNLLGNAIKFTPEGGSISIRTSILQSGEALLAVRDNGPGIPKKEMETVLSAFGQGSAAAQVPGRGTGLGLSIVTRLAELHGGSFKLRSEEKVGTEALVILPGSRVLRAPPAGARRHAEKVMAFPLRGAA